MSRSLTPNEPDRTAREEKSETRLRTVAPTNERVLYDQQLRDAEAASGERARNIVVRIGGVVGAEPGLVVLLVTAPDGPSTPAEDVWSEPVVLVDLRVASPDSVRERVQWALEASKAHGLLPPTIEEVWTFGAHPFRGDPRAIAQLCDARLRLVKLAFDGCPLVRCAYAQESGPNGEELVVTAELRAQDARNETIRCELLRQRGFAADLVRSVADWTTKQAPG
jgi:hypothetical protein